MKHLRLAHSADPIPGTVSPKKHKPISHVQVRPGHPSMGVYDQDDPTREEIAMGMNLLCAYAEESTNESVREAAAVVLAACKSGALNLNPPPKGRGA